VRLNLALWRATALTKSVGVRWSSRGPAGTYLSCRTARATADCASIVRRATPCRYLSLVAGDRLPGAPRAWPAVDLVRGLVVLLRDECGQHGAVLVESALGLAFGSGEGVLQGDLPRVCLQVERPSGVAGVDGGVGVIDGDLDAVSLQDSGAQEAAGSGSDDGDAWGGHVKAPSFSSYKITVAEKVRALDYGGAMSARSVNWTALRGPAGRAPAGEGLRERKKRLMRQQLSDTATTMFMERGFDAVRVSEIAEACGVSEKTVFNYFPTKESLVLDRWESTVVSLRSGLADLGIPPVEAVQRILASELGDLLSWLEGQEDPALARSTMQRFVELVEATPALRAHQRDALDRVVAVAAEILAERAGMSPDDPEPRIAATALVGLWDVEAHALRRHLYGDLGLDEVREGVLAEVRRAARVVDVGLGSLTASAPSVGLPSQY
jgi:AcrR family transcriptional regulator